MKVFSRKYHTGNREQGLLRLDFDWSHQHEVTRDLQMDVALPIECGREMGSARFLDAAEVQRSDYATSGTIWRAAYYLQLVESLRLTLRGILT
jgi:hypothetical protein